MTDHQPTPFPTTHAGKRTDHTNILVSEQWMFKFANGFGASVVRGAHTYGGPGLWELAVLDADDNLTYETPITDDVIGHLSEQAVADTLDRIANLPTVDVAP